MNDLDRLEEMVRAHLPRIVRLCTVILGNPQEAEDMAQEVFLKAFRSIGKFRGDAGVSTWLTRIAINVCRDHIRRRKWRTQQWEEAEELMDSAPGPTDRVMARQMAMRALKSLSPKEEVAVRLRFGGEYNTREIAEALDCSESTVKTYLHRAMRKMAKTLVSEGDR